MANTDETSIKLSEIIGEFALESLYMPQLAENIRVVRSDLNRPGLPLIGYFDHFEPERIQLIGNVEYKYLQSLSEELREQSIYRFMEKKPVAVILSSSLIPFDGILKAAEKFSVPVLRTSLLTSEFMAALIAFLNVALAPCITRHGVLVEVYGEGILILGDSGVGKSETAIELVKRGHRLIADDAVEIKKVSRQNLGWYSA